MKIKVIYRKTSGTGTDCFSRYPLKKAYVSTKDNIYVLVDVRDASGFHFSYQMSQDAVDTIKVSFSSNEMREMSVPERLDTAIREFVKKSQISSDSFFIAVVAIHFHNGNAYIANLGSSKCYRVRGRKIQQLTKDSSYREVPEFVSSSLLSETRKDTLCESNIHVEPNIIVCSIKENDIFLLCSDSLGDVTSLEKTLNTVKLDDSRFAEQRGRNRIYNALTQANNKDNVSMAILKCSWLKQRIVKFIILACIIFILAGGTVGYYLIYSERKQNTSDTQIKFNYFIQVGFFRYKDNADKVLKEINTKKPQYRNMIFVSEEFYSDKNGYYGRAVRVGPFHNEAQANIALRDIMSLGYESIFYKKVSEQNHNGR